MRFWQTTLSTTVLAACVAGSTAGCRPGVSIALPGGSAQPSPRAVTWFEQATARCHDIATWSAEIGVSGSVRGRTLRVKVLAGTTSTGKVRLEGVAPFGGPIFILAASDASATLWLPRESGVVRDRSTSDVLDALIGVALSGSDLHALLSGCVTPDARAVNGQTYGPDWASVDVGAGRTAFLRQSAGAWRVASAKLGVLTIGYDRFEGAMPGEVRVLTAGAAPEARLALRLSQVEENVPLADAVFAVDVPAAAHAVSLEELRGRGVGSDGVAP